MSKFTRMRLAQFTEVTTGSTPRAAHEDSWGDEVPFITPSDQSDHRREATPTRFLSNIGAIRLQNRLVPPRSTNLTCIGSTIGKVSMAETYSVTNQQITTLTAKQGVADSGFVYYLIKNWSGELKQFAAGSATPIINKSVLANFEFFIPPLSEQQAFADVLGALDDKIAANIKLAGLADEWVRAEYNRLVTLSDQQRTVAEIVVQSRNTANPELLATHVPYVGLEHIPRRFMWLEEHGTSAEVSSNKSHFQPGDILFGKLRPYFHKIVTAPQAGICSTDVLVLTPMDEALSGFALAALSDDSVVQAVSAASEGTRMPRTSWKDLATIQIPWPGHETAATFSSKVSAIREYVIGILAENQSLAATRDAILPQLMSGALKVKDAQPRVEAAF